MERKAKLFLDNDGIHVAILPPSSKELAALFREHGFPCTVRRDRESGGHLIYFGATEQPAAIDALLAAWLAEPTPTETAPTAQAAALHADCPALTAEARSAALG